MRIFDKKKKICSVGRRFGSICIFISKDEEVSVVIAEEIAGKNFQSFQIIKR